MSYSETTTKKATTKKATKQTKVSVTQSSRTLGYVSILPNTKTLMSTRKAGYNPYGAIADMVDNAMEPQVQANNIWVTVDANKHVIIADDGVGMDAKELKEAMTLGSEPNPKAPRKLLGGFGMGMKTAGSSMGTVITVLTRKAGNEVVSAVYDVVAIHKSRKFLIPLDNATKVEREIFARYTKGSYTGTVVIVSSLDQIKNRNTTSFVTALRRRLSETFRLYVQNSEITLDGVASELPSTSLYVNNELIQPSDIMMEQLGSRLMYDDTHQIRYNKDGEKAFALVRFKLFLLPDISGKTMLEEEYEDVRLNLNNQGLYVMRNNRQIVRADMLGIVGKDPNNNRFRGEIYIDGDLDEALALNFQKNDIASREERVQEQLKNIIRPQFNYIREIINQERGKRNAMDELIQEETKQMLKELNAKLKELGIGGKQKRETKEEAEEKEEKEAKKREKKDQEPKEPKGDNPPKSALEIQYMALGADGNIVEYTHKDNGGLLMTWNTEHPYYDGYLVKKDYDTRRGANILFLMTGLQQNKVFIANGGGVVDVASQVAEYNYEISKAVALLM